MAYFQYGVNILQDVLERAGELSATSGTTTSEYLTEAKRCIQRAYYDILEMAPWPWALKSSPGVINLVEKSTGTATFTHDSTTVSASATISTSMTGCWVWNAQKQIPYRISSHTAGSASFVIDAAYKETTATAVSYEIFKDEYDLASDVLKVWRVWLRNDQSRVIELITEGEMAALYPSRSVGTYPRKAAVIRGTTLRIVPWPSSDPLTLEYEYTAAPTSDFTFDGTASTDTPVIPQQDRHVLADLALAALYNVKNDIRGTDMLAAAQQKLAFMMNIYMPIGKVRLFVKPGQGVW